MSYTFQSLLFWKLILNLCYATGSHYKEWVSILVILEVDIKQALQHIGYKDIPEFQSLLFWKLILNRHAFVNLSRPIEFQSLLFWKLILNYNQNCRSVCEILVSILVILEVDIKLKIVRINGRPKVRFNPCYSGSWY